MLALGAADPILSRIYSAHWAIIPNLGIDFLLPPLLHVLPVHVASRIVIGVAMLLPFVGAIAYSCAVFGVRLLWPLVSALFAIRIAVLATAWDDYQRDVADPREIIATVQPGARVFVVSVSPEEAPEYGRNGPLSRRLSYVIRLNVYLPALLLIGHRAFWPFLFDNPSQQPVKTLSPYRALAERAGSIHDHHRLDTPGRVDL